MKPRTKFIIGGVLVIGTAGYLAASAIRDTGVYYLTPGELSAKTKVDPTFYNTGVKVGARVVNGSIVRDPGGREVSFRMTDGAFIVLARVGAIHVPFRLGSEKEGWKPFYGFANGYIFEDKNGRGQLQKDLLRVEAALTKILAQLEQLSTRDNAPQLVSSLLKKFDVVTGLSAWSDPKHSH